MKKDYKEPDSINELSKKYDIAIGKMGIRPFGDNKYTSVQEFGKNFRKAAINKNVSITFTTCL